MGYKPYLEANDVFGRPVVIPMDNIGDFRLFGLSLDEIRMLQIAYETKQGTYPITKDSLEKCLAIL